MNFFEHQERARRNTSVLVFLFFLAVAGIVIALSAFLSFFLLMQDSASSHRLTESDFWETFAFIMPRAAPFIVAVIGFVSWLRYLNLSGDGVKIAEFLGADRLPLAPETEQDQRLRNIVEEMAIASGVPVPKIYVMRDESGINAFAAGSEPTRAVVAVTQGALDTLNRDQLQGVVAHEFSHIFNGDMKLNGQLMGVLAGISFISTSGLRLLQSLGRSHGGRRNNGQGAVALLGIGFLIIGSIGLMFARIIKSAVSRQREFLADASAVQFTRNPNGLAEALARIQVGGSHIHHAGREETSHFFFSSVKNFALLATHPPIEERLKRLGFTGLHAAGPKGSQVSAFADRPVSVLSSAGRPSPQDVAMASSFLARLDPELRADLRKPHTAMQVILGLIARENENQAALDKLSPDVRELVQKTWPERRLPLVDLAVPALRRLDPVQASHFLMTLETMVVSNQSLRPFELAVLAILRGQLTPSSDRRRVSLNSVKPSAVELIKTLALFGHPDNESKAREAFEAGVKEIGLSGDSARSAWTVDVSTTTHLDRALQRMGQLAPNDKAQIFNAVWVAAQYDKVLTTLEAEYVRAVSEAIGVPVPLGMGS